MSEQSVNSAYDISWGEEMKWLIIKAASKSAKVRELRGDLTPQEAENEIKAVFIETQRTFGVEDLKLLAARVASTILS